MKSLTLIALTLSSTAAFAANDAKDVLNAFKASEGYRAYAAKLGRDCTPAIKLQAVEKFLNREGASISVLAVATNAPCTNGSFGLERHAAILQVETEGRRSKITVRESSIASDLNAALAVPFTVMNPSREVAANECYAAAIPAYAKLAAKMLGKQMTQIGVDRVRANGSSHRFTIKAKHAEDSSVATGYLTLDEACQFQGYQAETSERPLSDRELNGEIPVNNHSAQ